MNGRSVMLAGLLAAAPGLACAPVPGEGRFVQIATEEAIIIWDEGAKREHFIRRASFDTNAKDFGFLVPTPTKPELGESDDAAFTLLAGITTAQQKLVAERPAAVTVLEQKTVAGLDAVVLEANDAAALDGWLKKNGYPSSPQLVEWYAPYIAAKWKITAFKIAADAPKVATSAVRMSFQTERPFFPYREPATQRPAGERLLRVYLVADARFKAVIGEKTEWFGKAVWADEIQSTELAQLLKLAKLPVLAGGGGRWVTKFEDRSSPRSALDELYFARADDQAPLEPAPTVADNGARTVYELAGGAVVIILAALAVYLWLRRRSRRKERRLFG